MDILLFPLIGIVLGLIVLIGFGAAIAFGIYMLISGKDDNGNKDEA